MRAASICVMLIVLSAGCATTTGRRGLRPPVDSPQAQNGSAPARAGECATRLNRTRAGGTVGSVVGLIAASALGSPFLGILYQVGGYAAGYASADNCKKQNTAVANASGKTPGPIVASVSLPPDNIEEEDLK